MAWHSNKMSLAQLLPSPTRITGERCIPYDRFGMQGLVVRDPSVCYLQRLRPPARLLT